MVIDDWFDPQQSFQETVFVVFDVETTGLSPAYGHRVCEIGCLRARDGVVLGHFESLVNPGRAISPGAFEVNRITAEMLKDAPAFDGVADAVLDVMRDAVLVAHNAAFDLGFLAAELVMGRRPRPAGPVIDTLTLARRIYGLARNNLTAVARALDVEITPTHRAMEDVRTTFGVLERILWDLEQRWEITTLGELIRFQGGSIPFPAERAVPLPPTIADALEISGRVRMRYIDAHGHETNRTVRPLRVNAMRGNLYLVAHCYERDAIRTFRLDRVVEMVLES